MIISKKIFMSIAVFVFLTTTYAFGADYQNYDSVIFSDGSKVARLCYSLEQSTKYIPVDPNFKFSVIPHFTDNGFKVERIEFTSNTDIRSIYGDNYNMPFRTALAMSCRVALDYLKDLMSTYPAADGSENFEAVYNALIAAGNREEFIRFERTSKFFIALRNLETAAKIVSFGGEESYLKMIRDEIEFGSVINPVTESSYFLMAKRMGVIDALGVLQYLYGGEEVLMAADMSLPLQVKITEDNQVSFFKKSPESVDITAIEGDKTN